MNEDGFLDSIKNFGFISVEGPEAEINLYNVRILDDNKNISLGEASNHRKKLYALKPFLLLKYNNYMDRGDINVIDGYNEDTTIGLLKSDGKFIGLLYRGEIFVRELSK